MQSIHINRFADYGKPDEGTFGVLTMDDFMCYTVERPWLDNAPFVSCIPLGVYQAEWHQSLKFGPCMIIYGGTVSKYYDPVYPRSSILIHPANWSNQLEGCIGLGDAVAIMDGRSAVTNSRKTVTNFLNRINM